MTTERIDWRTYDYSEGPPRSASRLKKAGGGRVASALTNSTSTTIKPLSPTRSNTMIKPLSPPRSKVRNSETFDPFQLNGDVLNSNPYPNRNSTNTLVNNALPNSNTKEFAPKEQDSGWDVPLQQPSQFTQRRQLQRPASGERQNTLRSYTPDGPSTRPAPIVTPDSLGQTDYGMEHNRGRSVNPTPSSLDLPLKTRSAGGSLSYRPPMNRSALVTANIVPRVQTPTRTSPSSNISIDSRDVSEPYDVRHSATPDSPSLKLNKPLENMGMRRPRGGGNKPFDEITDDVHRRNQRNLGLMQRHANPNHIDGGERNGAEVESESFPAKLYASDDDAYYVNRNQLVNPRRTGMDTNNKNENPQKARSSFEESSVRMTGLDFDNDDHFMDHSNQQTGYSSETTPSHTTNASASRYRYTSLSRQPSISNPLEMLDDLNMNFGSTNQSSYSYSNHSSSDSGNLLNDYSTDNIHKRLAQAESAGKETMDGDDDTNNDEWKKAEEEWNRAEAAELEYHTSDVDRNLEESDHELEDDELNEDELEFESFAGDRSSVTTGKESATIDDDTNTGNRNSSPLFENSLPLVISQPKPQQPRQKAPMSILRSGKFDSGFVSDSGVSMHSNGMPKRAHPWDKHNDEEEDASGTDTDSNSDASNYDITEGDDSLFKFDDDDSGKMKVLPLDSPMNRRKQKQRGGKSGKRSTKLKDFEDDYDDDDDDDDSCSIDDEYERDSENNQGGKKMRADTLQDRAKQAWSVRNKAATTSGTSSKGRKAGGSGGGNGKDGRVTYVNFAGAEKNTVHEFIPDSHSESDGATEVTEHSEAFSNSDDDTYAGRSMNSEYTKSNESEMEDMIKDFFLIGRGKATNPGKRRLRYRKGRKQKIKEYYAREDRIDPEIPRTISNDIDSSEEDETTVGGDTITLDDAIKPVEKSTDKSKPLDASVKKRSNKDSERNETVGSETSDPLALVWNYVEDGVNVVSSALGIGVSDNDDSTPKPDSKGESSMQMKGINRDSPTVLNPSFPLEKGNEKSTNIKATDTDKEKSPLENWMDFAIGLLFHDEDSVEEITEKTSDKKSSDVSLSRSTSDESFLENKETSLLKLAVSAAKTNHELQDIVYDESSDIDVVNEIKFIVITIALPVGMLFEQNEVCCWIARIFKRGNAATSARGDKVQVGDQLAAINGSSTMYKEVGEVCKMLSEAPNSNDIEMTFLRYIGPLRPAPTGELEQEGYEVIDPVISIAEEEESTTLEKGVSRNEKSESVKNLSDKIINEKTLTPPRREQEQTAEGGSGNGFDANALNTENNTKVKSSESIYSSEVVHSESNEKDSKKKGVGKTKKKFGLFKVRKKGS